jgi:hypothetical protein
MPVAIRIPTNNARRCDCGRYASYQAPIEVISSSGQQLHERLTLCTDCYIAYLEAQLAGNGGRQPCPDLGDAARLIHRYMRMLLQNKQMADETRRKQLREAQAILNRLREAPSGRTALHTSGDAPAAGDK